MSIPSRTWAAGYMHRAVQLAREESLRPDQVTEAIHALEWFLGTPPDEAACRDGATTAAADVRVLSNGQREWVLLGATNFRTAGQLLTIQTDASERRRLMSRFQDIVAGAQDTLTGAEALVARIEQRWRTGITPAPRSEVPPPPEPSADLSVSAARYPSLATVADPTLTESLAFAPAPPVLPLPDPAWFQYLIDFVPARVEKGAITTAGSREQSLRDMWKGMADWIAALTTLALGEDWTAKRHQWQNSGYLNNNYWGRIYPTRSRFGDMFHVGVQLAHRPATFPIEEFEPPYPDLTSIPVLGVWGSASTDEWKRQAKVNHALVLHGMREYDRHQRAAVRTSPELWLQGGSAMRWRRVGGRGADRRAGAADQYLATGPHVLTEMRQFLAGEAEGRYPHSCSLFGPLMPLTDAVHDPERAAGIVFSGLRAIGRVVQDTYAAMESAA